MLSTLADGFGGGLNDCRELAFDLIQRQQGIVIEVVHAKVVELIDIAAKIHWVGHLCDARGGGRSTDNGCDWARC